MVVLYPPANGPSVSAALAVVLVVSAPVALFALVGIGVILGAGDSVTAPLLQAVTAVASAKAPAERRKVERRTDEAKPGRIAGCILTRSSFTEEG
jgi:hypothetical protein